MTGMSPQTYSKQHFPLAACCPDSPPPSPTDPLPLASAAPIQPKTLPESDEEIDLSLELEDLKGEIHTAAALALRSVENFALKRLRFLPKMPYSSFQTRLSVAGAGWKVPKKRDLEDYMRKKQLYGPGRRGKSVSPQKLLRSARPFAFIVETATGRSSCSSIGSRRQGRTRGMSEIPAPEPRNCAY